MTLPRTLFAVSILALLGAWPASAGVRLAERDEPVRALSHERHARAAPFGFDMVGLHWRGPGSVWFRTRSADGSWSGWQPAQPEAEDVPDRDTGEGRSRPGWKLGNPYWTGRSDAIEYRLVGKVTALHAFFIRSPVEAIDQPLRFVARASRPGIITRAEWGADESIVRAPPYYADRLRFAVVHHTAGTNSYTAAQSAAIVRGIQRYHVLANGWNDIGYNFLVDKYGQVFEGRGGGIDKNVVGAHAQGFNTGSTGVSILGTYSSSPISSAARSALVKLLAWRLDVAHVDPLSRLKWVSGGNPKYPAGTVVTIRAISGHRDTGPTTCPGNALYGQLPGIASRVSARGLPKLYDPEVSGELGGPVRVIGRLSTALDWTVTIRDEDGDRVARGSGSGTGVDWTWDASAVPYGKYTYRIAAGSDVRPWTAPVPRPPPLAIGPVTASPRALTPNGDGVSERTRIAVSLSVSATVSVEILNGSGAVVRYLATDRSLSRGTTRLGWVGADDGGALVPDGRYRIRVHAEAPPGQSDTRSGPIVVDRTLGFLAASANPFSPNGDGRLDETTVSFELTRTADVLVRVMRSDRVVKRLQRGTLEGGSYAFAWDGGDRYGMRAPDGMYRIRVDATTTTFGTRTLRRGVRVDTIRPGLRIRRAVYRDDRTIVRFWLGEPATLLVWWGAPRWWSWDREGEIERDAGYHRVALAGRAAEVRLRAVDAAENRRTKVTTVG
jgi:flagellar hook assembly protein FlgD